MCHGPKPPGVYVREGPRGEGARREDVRAAPAITGVATSITAFIGRTLRGPVDRPVLVRDYPDFERQFGGLWSESTLGYAVHQYFMNGGVEALVVRVSHGGEGEGEGEGDGAAIGFDQIAAPHLQGARRGLWALDHADLFNLLCIPPFTRQVDVDRETWTAAATYCRARRAMLLVDPPSAWTTPADVLDSTIGVEGTAAAMPARDANAALYFPRVRMADPLDGNRPATFASCGVVAGVFARTDAHRGVWKAPAGRDATLVGVHETACPVTDVENGLLNPMAVNALRTLPTVGTVVWGARTLRGADTLASDWKYVPVRRLALHIEESLHRGTAWAAFEPNGETLWSRLRLSVGAFMQDLFRRGAFQGTSPRDAYFVKCDAETTTPSDIEQGVVNLTVGFAPLKPGEFIIIRIGQKLGGVR